MHRTRSRRVSGLLLLFLMLLMGLAVWTAVDRIESKLLNFSNRLFALEHKPEKTVEITIERHWDKSTGTYVYNVDARKEN